MISFYRKMFRRFVAVLLTCPAWLPPAPAQESGGGLPPGVLLLSRIKRHVRQELAVLPDYTCLETSRRNVKPRGNRGVLKPLDTLRLEVLDTGDKELYAPPGGRAFESEHPSSFTNTGLTGTGVFSL